MAALNLAGGGAEEGIRAQAFSPLTHIEAGPENHSPPLLRRSTPLAAISVLPIAGSKATTLHCGGSSLPRQGLQLLLSQPAVVSTTARGVVRQSCNFQEARGSSHQVQPGRERLGDSPSSCSTRYHQILFAHPRRGRGASTVQLPGSQTTLSSLSIEL